MAIQIIINRHHVNCDVKHDAHHFDHGFHKNGYMCILLFLYIIFICWKISERLPYTIKLQYPEVIALLS